ncbi:hypothetical protein CSB09_03460 [Candidatus Gracilibacteria bacterium]|nr:MAG: hypothetical protein CSB09_03460 [Candidatus Gracilibacteria bacterium]
MVVSFCVLSILFSIKKKLLIEIQSTKKFRNEENIKKFRNEENIKKFRNEENIKIKSVNVYFYIRFF